MMKISLAEFVGGKEADDAYNKLCELTGLEWDAKKTCYVEHVKTGTLYDVWRYTCCDYEHSESKTDAGATSIPMNFCPNCGAKVVD